jgi:hypothetical protein
MKKGIMVLIIFRLALISLTAQQNKEIFQYYLKLDSSYLFIDNSNRNWYTLNLKTDTLFSIEGNIYFYNNKTIQIGSIQFNNGKPEGVMGSSKAEEYALRGHKKWELDYQKKTLRRNLKNGEELFYNVNGKPFLIWWFVTPSKSKAPEREIEVRTNRIEQDTKDTLAIELNATNQLFLDFVIHGNTQVSISTPVLENETLADEIIKLKKIANTLNVYGSYIDLKILSKRLKSNETIVLSDSLNLINIEIPNWINLIQSPYKNTFVTSLPEKDNITNAILIYWQYKTDSTDFQDFINKRQSAKSDRENIKEIENDDRIERYFYTQNNSWFQCQDIYMEGESVFCFVNFIATSSTYNYNLKRLNEFIDKIKLK